jgi:hypothetical protein
MTDSEVKGVWFASAHNFLLDELGADRLEAVVKAMAPAHREALQRPASFEWYPEGALQDMLNALFEVECSNDRELFEDLMRRCTRMGVSRFFRVLVSLGSFRFVTSKVPVMWGRIRLGAGEVEVDFLSDPERARVSYSNFPWFSDPLYRLMTRGSLAGVVELCIGHTPELIDVDGGPSHYTVDIVNEMPTS